MDLLVSVIIPVYNSEKYIHETIQSVLNQTYKNFELIIVNDGSTDNSLSIIENSQKKDNRIKILNKINSGVSETRNFGLNIAKGEYVAFLDSDDVWLPNNLELKVNCINQNFLDAVYSYCEIIDEESFKTGIVKTGLSPLLLKNILCWEGNYITIPSGYLFKKDSILLIGGFNKSLSNNADQEIIIRLLSFGSKISSISEVTWLYRRHNLNMSSNIQLMEKESILVYKIAAKNNLYSNFFFRMKCYSKMNLVLSGCWYRDGGSVRKAIYRFIIAFCTSPLSTIILMLKKLK